MGKYQLLSSKEIAYLLMNGAERIDFTHDTDLETEPTGWYGFMHTNLFDYDAIVAGYWGNGIEAVWNEYCPTWGDLAWWVMNYIRESEDFNGINLDTKFVCEVIEKEKNEND